jgi:GT2 family glycosyltransferase
MRTLPAEVAVVYSDAELIDVNGTSLPGNPSGAPFERPEGRVFERLLRGNFLCAPTVLVRRAAIEHVGGYDETLHYEDWDMWLRLADQYEFRYFPRTVVRHRVLDTSMSHSPVHRKRMVETSIRIALKWTGRNRDLDRGIARIVRANALQLGLEDPTLGRGYLRTAARLDGSPVRRVASELARPTLFRVARHARTVRRRLRATRARTGPT